jgi:glucose-1-phosphate thymidylyltransferase
MASAARRKTGATIFGYQVSDPERYGVVDFDEQGRAKSIEEKPKQPKSHWAVTGLYFYDSRACQFAKDIRPSARGELEITALNNRYLEERALTVEIMGRGYAWLDTGTHETLIQAGEFVRTIEQRQGLKIGCPEEVAYRLGYIDRAALEGLGRALKKSPYGEYLLQIAAGAH